MQDDVLGNAGLTLTVEHAIDTGKKFNYTVIYSFIFFFFLCFCYFFFTGQCNVRLTAVLVLDDCDELIIPLLWN